MKLNPAVSQTCTYAVNMHCIDISTVTTIYYLFVFVNKTLYKSLIKYDGYD